MKILPILSICALLAATGCTVGPNYTAPQPTLTEKFSSVPAKPAENSTQIVEGQEAVARWWLVFNDPELNSLIERMTAGNFDLQEAVSRVRLARAQRTGITAGIWPTIDASAGYNRGRGSENVVLPFGGGVAEQPVVLRPLNKTAGKFQLNKIRPLLPHQAEKPPVAGRL